MNQTRLPSIDLIMPKPDTLPIPCAYRLLYCIIAPYKPTSL